jgi:endonuclease-3
MTSQETATAILPLLKKEFPDPQPQLNHTNAYELLFAVILSAQCTDERVNKTTPALFARYPELKDYAEADLEELTGLLRSINFFNNKAKNIKAAAQKIITDFGGEVPGNMADLVTLPGVARKTANVVLHQWFEKNEGFVVDTHVIRLANWFGLTTHSDPVKIEKDLMEVFPQEEWGDTALRIVLLGRKTLTARNPQYKGTVWEKFILLEIP